MFPSISEDRLWFVVAVGLAFFPMWSLLRMVRNRRRSSDRGTDRDEGRNADRDGDRLSVVAELVPREWVTLLFVWLTLCVGAIFVRAELGTPPDPAGTPSPCRAPWFFCGLQELVSRLPVTLAGRIVPILLVLGLIVFPWVSRPRAAGRYELRGRGVSVWIFLTLWCGWFLLIGVGVLRTT